MKLSAAGYLLDKELKYLRGAVDDPVRPLCAIVGGGKVSTKIPVIESLIEFNRWRNDLHLLQIDGI